MPDDLTLQRLFHGVWERFGDRTAVVTKDQTWSYRDLGRQIRWTARRLHDMGVRPGVHVALLLTNGIEYVLADQAIINLGAVKIPINTMLSALEVNAILTDSQAEVVILDDHRAADVRQAASPQLRQLLIAGDVATRPGDTAPDDEAAGPDVRPSAPDNVALIAYTGGTTGRQKGVIHTHRGLVLNALAHVIETGLLDDERMLLTTPLPHTAGYLLHAGLLKGATCIIDTRFDPDRVLDLLADGALTFLFVVPTMIYRLLDRAAGRDAVGTGSLRTILYGAAPITRDRLEEGLRRFGPVFMQLYGQTEAPNFLTRLTREDHDLTRPEILASCGRAAMMMDVAALGDDGSALQPGQTGEICARGPYVMAGYYDLPGRTAETLRGGWLHTGDLGYVDADGYVFLLDRKNDMIITGGLNVYSAEVENVLAGHSGIAASAVVGIPHSDWGEAVVAFVVPVSSRTFDATAAAEHCRRHLAGYKCPKAYRVIDSLPVTGYGKVDKKALRAAWQQESDRTKGSP
jgi:fatty-acyl-CoA synthase